MSSIHFCIKAIIRRKYSTFTNYGFFIKNSEFSAQHMALHTLYMRCSHIVHIRPCRSSRLTIHTVTSRDEESTDLIGFLINNYGASRCILADRNVQTPVHLIAQLSAHVCNIGTNNILRKRISRYDTFLIKSIYAVFRFISLHLGVVFVLFQHLCQNLFHLIPQFLRCKHLDPISLTEQPHHDAVAVNLGLDKIPICIL